MGKIKTLLKGPFLVQAGYGNHARQIFRALYADSDFDVHVESVKWGNCPYLTENNEEKKAIKMCIKKFMLNKQKKDESYDLFVHVTIPNEFEKLGKINIGVTAGIETDRVGHVWVQKCEEMDLIIVPSEHSKNVLEKTTIEWKNQKTEESGEFKINKPIIVCHEGVDTSVYKKLGKMYDNSIANLDFKCDFNFLHVGQWGRGGFGEDRKNIARLVRYFAETFRGRKDVGLVLKINMARNNQGDFIGVQDRLKQIKSNFKEEELPPIHLLHGQLTHEEMSNL